MSRRSEQELRDVALRAALEAAQRERTRCLWCLQQLLVKAEQGLEKKLMPAGEEHLAKVRLELTRSIVRAAQVLIHSGAKPNEATNPDG